VDRFEVGAPLPSLGALPAMSRSCCRAGESPDARLELLPPPLLPEPLPLELPLLPEPLPLELLEPLPLELLLLDRLLELLPLELLLDPLLLPELPPEPLPLERLLLDPPLPDPPVLDEESLGTCLVWANAAVFEVSAIPPPAHSKASILPNNLRRDSIMFPLPLDCLLDLMLPYGPYGRDDAAPESPACPHAFRRVL
jgi:hypothetical protein